MIIVGAAAPHKKAKLEKGRNHHYPNLKKKGVAGRREPRTCSKQRLEGVIRLLCASKTNLSYCVKKSHNPPPSRPQPPRTIVNIEHIDDIQDDQPEPQKKKAGRPKGTFGLKRQIQEYARNPALALPKTDHQRLKELKDMLIKSSGKDVVEKMISIALNDNHPAQMAAIKMCVDRTLPVSMFEKDKSQRSAVTINITGIGAPTATTTTIDEDDIQDIEAKNG